MSGVNQTGQLGSGADGSGGEFANVEDESGMGFASGAPDSGEDASGVDGSGEDGSGVDGSGEDASGVDGSGEDGSSSGAGMSSFFLTNLFEVYFCVPFYK